MVEKVAEANPHNEFGPGDGCSISLTDEEQKNLSTAIVICGVYGLTVNEAVQLTEHTLTETRPNGLSIYVAEIVWRRPA